jgi:hypothetical protein
MGLIKTKMINSAALVASMSLLGMGYSRKGCSCYVHGSTKLAPLVQSILDDAISTCYT